METSDFVLRFLDREPVDDFMPTSPEVEAFVASQGGWLCEPAG